MSTGKRVLTKPVTSLITLTKAMAALDMAGDNTLLVMTTLRLIPALTIVKTRCAARTIIERPYEADLDGRQEE